MSVAATVGGVPVHVDEVDAREDRLRGSRLASSLPRRGTSEGRQLRRWLTQLLVTDPDVRVRISFDLDEVVDGELLDGTMRVTGRLPGGFKPYDSRMRLEFYDEADGRTRLEVRQWLPEQYVSPSEGVGARPSPSWTPCSPRTQPANG